MADWVKQCSATNLDWHINFNKILLNVNLKFFEKNRFLETRESSAIRVIFIKSFALIKQMTSERKFILVVSRERLIDPDSGAKILVSTQLGKIKVDIFL